MGKPKPKCRLLAEKIAEELFTAPWKKKVHRLVQEIGEDQWAGGWCKQAVIDTVERILREEAL